MTNSEVGSKRKKKRGPTSSTLPVIQPLVAGIDIGSTQHWVCGPADGETPNVRVFGTTTVDLNELADWLLAQRVTSVAMESTYIYWIPVYELLESRGIGVVLVNARTLHNVPGRKTDFSDCQWIQLLHSCGLLRGSFRPSESITRMRALHRQLANLVVERGRCVQWMQKALDQMNVQVHRAVTDLTGVTGMAIVRAIVAGERDASRLARHRDARCKKSVEDITKHLTGTWRDEHLFNLESALRFYDFVQESIAAYEARLLKELAQLQSPEREHASVPTHPNLAKERRLRCEQPARTALWRFAGVDLTRIDGINIGTAQVVMTEIGPKVDAFPSEHHFVSWLRLCPRTPISGGKPVKNKKNGLGANRVAASLRIAAVSVQRSKSAIGAAYRRIARNKGADVAIFATARHLARLIYRMLRYGQDYVDVGEQAYEEHFRERRVAALVENARSLGYQLMETATA